MNKQRLHQLWTKLRPLDYWHLFMAAALCFLVFVFAFRHNNVTMLTLRDEVFRADEENGDVEGALRKLREHIYSHMNTDLTPKDDSIRPPIQLKHRYERLVAAEKKRVSAANEKIYTKAQAVCEAQIPDSFSGRSRVACIERYVTANGEKQQQIPDSLYKFDFVSPTWSPDLAGWSLVFVILLALLGVMRLVLERWASTHFQ